MILLYITITLFVLYSSLIIYYWFAWRSIPDFSPGTPVHIRISIIIAARNEEKNIGHLLKALDEQDYPKNEFETIVVDDHSTDGTADIVKTFPGVKLIALKDDEINAYKKKAIETGIRSATGELIVTTDADCIPPREWLSLLAAYKTETNAVFIAAPVQIECNSSFLQVFQAMDFMVLQGITAASVHNKFHSMCNGANLAYERKVFYEVEGFKDIDHLASGDDMLLMHKISRLYSDRVFFLKSTGAIVSTQPVYTWKDFFDQRRRWASKAGHYKDKGILPVLILVYLLNLSLLGLLVAGFWSPVYWLYFVCLWIAKTLVEFPFFYSLARFFNKMWATRYFFFFQPIHILYTVIAGFFGQSGHYHWKGRTVK